MRAVPRVVAYTAAFGEATAPHQQPIAPDVPLVCFTDRSGMRVPGYDVRQVDLPQSTPRLRARYVKVMAHAMFPDAEWAIWFDSPIRFKTGRLTDLVEAAGAASMAVHRHAVRSCIYQEAGVCKQTKLDDPMRIDAQMSRYRQMGYPAAAGLWENSLVVRRLADPRVVELNEAWWDEIVRGCVRDQLSLPVVVRQVGVEVQPLPGSVYDDPYAAMARGPMSGPAMRRAEEPRRRWFRHGAFARPQSRLFHAAFYRATNPEVNQSRFPRLRGHGVHPLDHYLTVGWRRGRDPHTLFDVSFYLEANPDVALAGVEPLTHYLEVGAREGRDPHPLFDVSYYLEANPDVARSGVEPLTHYLDVGGREGRDPHVLFDTAWYLAEYGDACRHAEGGPLGHYLQKGWRAGARPNRWFSPSDYRRRYPDVATAGMEPLEHYLRYGIVEGRDPRDGGGVTRTE